MNILFLTAATGGGHVIAARALMQHMEVLIPNCRTYLIDTLKYINPFVDRLVTGTYLNTIKTLPGVYGRFYDLTEKDERLTFLVKNFNRLLSHRLLSLLESYKPDIVICVHTIPLQMLSHLKEKKLVNIPVIGIVTDYTYHTFWKLDGVDAFVVAHECIKHDMAAIGIRKDRIYTCGIPVMEKFLIRTERRLILKRLGLELKPTFLLMGGSLGFGGLELVCSSLLKLTHDEQIIAVCGYNNKLQARLQSLAGNSPGRLRVFGYSDRINELMDASDLLITKPGGVTVSEALVKRLPLLITSPIPGQEERNARFLADSGAAVQLLSSVTLETVLKNTIGRPDILKKMSEAAGKLAKPHACEDIAELIEDLIVVKQHYFASKSFDASFSSSAPGATAKDSKLSLQK